MGKHNIKGKKTHDPLCPSVNTSVNLQNSFYNVYEYFIYHNEVIHDHSHNSHKR